MYLYEYFFTNFFFEPGLIYGKIRHWINKIRGRFVFTVVRRGDHNAPKETKDMDKAFGFYVLRLCGYRIKFRVGLHTSFWNGTGGMLVS